MVEGSNEHQMSQRIVVATDVRFWRRETGAHQRIFSLVKYLQASGADVTTLFLSSIDESQDLERKGASKDRGQILGFGLKVVSLVDDFRPNGVIESVVWHTKCILNAILPKSDLSKVARRSKRLQDFASAELKNRFMAQFSRIDPDLVIVEYVTLSYLVPDAKNRGRARFLLDTHDLLSRRCQQFKDRGLVHWVDISRSEEQKAFEKFDGILAIQDDEAAQMRAMIGENRVITVAHPVPFLGHRSDGESVGAIGYLASDNAANLDAFQWFVDQVWPQLKVNVPYLKFRVGGAICDRLNSHQKESNIEFVGRVDDVADFYESVDVVVNPIRFGTGLKIKNLEAFRFGLPLVTTTHGSEGLIGGERPESELAWIQVASADEMIEALTRLLGDPDFQMSLRRRVEYYVNNKLQPEQVYAELMEWIVRDEDGRDVVPNHGID